MFDHKLWGVTNAELEDMILSSKWARLAKDKIGQLMANPKSSGKEVTGSQAEVAVTLPSDMNIGCCLKTLGKLW